MLENVVRLTVEATINDGQFEAFCDLAAQMAGASDLEPGTLGYEFFFSPDQKRCRLLEIYADADAILAHFQGPVVTQLVPKMGPLCKMDRFEIYGDPGPEVTAIATGFGAQFFSYWKGLSR